MRSSKEPLLYGNSPRLYSVRAYEILSVEVNPVTEPQFIADGLKKLAGINVRIESSDSNGRPIIRTYRLRVGDDGSLMRVMGYN